MELAGGKLVGEQFLSNNSVTPLGINDIELNCSAISCVNCGRSFLS